MKYVIILIIAILISSCQFEKDRILDNFQEIEKLNEILIENQSQLNGRNNIDSVSYKIESTSSTIQQLKRDLNLFMIESHDTIYFQNKKYKPGIAYYFGKDRSITKNHTILVYAQDPETLEVFKYYEQFSDCARKEKIDENWVFSVVNTGCNN